MADTIALIGGETLLGQEVREVFGETSLASQLRLVAAEDEDAGKLTEIGGTAAFLTKLDPDAVEDAALIVLAGSDKSSKEALAAGALGNDCRSDELYGRPAGRGIAIAAGGRP